MFTNKKTKLHFTVYLLEFQVYLLGSCNTEIFWYTDLKSVKPPLLYSSNQGRRKVESEQEQEGGAGSGKELEKEEDEEMTK